MKTYRSLIIDDEPLARFTLKTKLEEVSGIELIGEADSLKEAEEKIVSLKPDLIFLDIQLADGIGFDLFDHIEYTGKVIFVTAYDQYALRAFEINAVDYLMKPVSSKRLVEAVHRLHEKAESAHSLTRLKLNYTDRIMVMLRKCINFIKIDQINHIKASREYSIIYTNEGKEYLSNRSLGEWESVLPEQNFCRIHRGTIINFDFIIRINTGSMGLAEVAMQGIPDPLPISRMYFKKLKQKYNL